MDYELGNAPILSDGQKVTVSFTGKDSVDGVIVGCASTDLLVHPQYLVECTDGKYPSIGYAFRTFVAPLSCIEIRL